MTNDQRKRLPAPASVNQGVAIFSDSAAARTIEPPSALRGIAAGKHARCINLDEVCILDPDMSRKILMTFRTRGYGDVLRVFSKQCKFKTVRRILLPLNISWEGITLGTG
jgi:hypothetical protein